MSKKIRLLIVDDSPFICQLLRRVLEECPDMEVLGQAENAKEAREKIKELNPDVITLDVEMPGMNGLDFLEKIMTLRPMPVVMVSTLTKAGADATLRALEIGAVDFVPKPTENVSQGLMDLKEELAEKIRAASKAKVHAKSRIISTKYTEKLSPPPPRESKNKVIVLGSSTGGVEALYELVAQLPRNCPPVLIVQHMPGSFVPSLVQHLDERSKAKVVEAKDNDLIMPGKIYIAPGTLHLTVRRGDGGFICYTQEGQRVSGHIPSVDVLFKSAAKVLGNRAVGVILTGMGRDGAEGLLEIRQAGGKTIGQDEHSCVVYGMPKAALEIGAVEVQVSLADVATQMLKSCGWK